MNVGLDVHTEPSLSSLAKLLGYLDLERLDRDLFRGENPESTRTRLFGGHVLAQGLVAAQRTVDGRPNCEAHFDIRQLNLADERPGLADRDTEIVASLRQRLKHLQP